MSKKTFKSQASSSRAVSGNALTGSGFGFGVSNTSFAQGPSSTLSYIYEPPDLAGLSDPSVGVSFKNLQKKDSTTKAKALEDLHNHVTARIENKNSLDEVFLNAWSKLFPRTSIDNSNRVRQLAYALHGKIVSHCGKSFVKYMPTTVGPWLAGLFDRDRQVVRSAKESFDSTFATDEKRKGVWKAFQEPILDYCLNTIQNESIQTLSDERTSSPDDAEAKYSRAIGGALLTLTGLLDTLTDNDLRKHQESYSKSLQSEALWSLASSTDPGLRRAVFRLMVSTADRLPDLVNIPEIGNLLIKQLSAEQTGSAYEFIRALTYYTKKETLIWTTLYASKNKRPPSARLKRFLSRGSFGVGPEFYKELSILLALVPLQVIEEEQNSSSESRSSDILASLRDGITGNAGTRRDAGFQTTEAWLCFLKLTDRLAKDSTSDSTKQSIVAHNLLPLVKHFVEPSLVTLGRNWPSQPSIIQEAFGLAWKHCSKSTEKEMKEISDGLIETMQTSQPEQSKDFKKSQESVISSFTRWYNLQAVLIKSSSTLKPLFSDTAIKEIEAATDLLKGRNGKPYGAATILDISVNTVPETSLENSGSQTALLRFCEGEVPRLMQSPSAPALIRVLEKIGHYQDVKAIFDAAVEKLLASPKSPSRSNALQLLATTHWPSSADNSDRLAEAILEDLEAAMTTESASWSLPLAVIDSPSAPDTVDEQILSRMMQGLEIDEQVELAVSGFNQLAGRNSSALRKFAQTPRGPDLLSKLLYLSHSGSEGVQSKAATLRDAIGGMTGDGKVNPIGAIIRSNVLSTDDLALPMASLWSQAERYLQSLSSEQRSVGVASLIPDLTLWKQSLGVFMEHHQDPALALIDSLGGAVHLVLKTSDEVSPVAKYDSQAYSAPLRAALFTTKLLASNSKMELSGSGLSDVYNLLTIVAILLSDSLASVSQIPIYNLSGEFDEQEIIASLNDIRELLANWVRESIRVNDAGLNSSFGHMLNKGEGLTPMAYLNARACIILTQAIEDAQNLPKELNGDSTTLSRIRKTPRLFSDLILLTTTSSPNASLKLFNELVSDLTTSKGVDSNLVLQQMIMLNVLLRNNDIELDGVPKQRLVYFVKACVAILEDRPSPALIAETLKSLATILPSLADIYDEFWKSIIELSISTMHSSNGKEINTIHAALQIYTCLGKLLRDEANEDLQEAWTELEPDIIASRLTFLQNQGKSSPQQSQPLQIVYELLYRQISQSPASVNISPVDLYPIMLGDSTILQRTVYLMLEKLILAGQEQVSLDAALSTDYTARLPTDLLALVDQVPEENNTLDLQAHPSMPSSLSRYLLGWKLIFSHWTNASYKVRAMYVAELKQGPQVEQFLTFCFTALIEQYGGRNKAGFDPSKLPSITVYDLENAIDPEMEYLWLLCNICFNMLLHTPHLVKSWYTNSCPKALKAYVETWTSKHISPIVIAKELGTVSEWKPPSDDASSELTIKVSAKACEVTASLPLDETFISIKIHLPSSYPLSPISLSTAQRVGIDEKKWQGFLNVSLIIMNFSSTSQGLGAVIDGISAWKNNVLGALKGHNECAICYSTVSEDGKVPTKKCATCGHLFHGLCLYKWFQRSAGSSCPLCRNAFNYG